MADIAAIEQALERLACDVELQQRLTHEAIHRELLDWKDYGAEIWQKAVRYNGPHTSKLNRFGSREHSIGVACRQRS
jgi:hypothetical protein